MQERFGIFNFKISFLYKCIKSLEAEVAAKFGVKGVHIFWIYSLYNQPRGLTASEIAKTNSVNRSLVSREIQKLRKENIVYFASDAADNRYNVRILLTEKGKDVAHEIQRIGMQVQQQTNHGIPDEEILIFYSVLERMAENLGHVVNEKKL